MAFGAYYEITADDPKAQQRALDELLAAIKANCPDATPSVAPAGKNGIVTVWVPLTERDQFTLLAMATESIQGVGNKSCSN